MPCMAATTSRCSRVQATSKVSSKPPVVAPFARRLSNRRFFAGSQDDSNGPKSPLHGFNILKNLTAEKKVRGKHHRRDFPPTFFSYHPAADGQPPKRRGPKPDSKPALTRRQELNRQAQRTHRERKERYIAALEQEVLRLKETFTNVIKERDAFAEENRKLRDVLVKHGLNPELLGLPPAVSSSGSFSGSYQPASSSTSISPPPNKFNNAQLTTDNGAHRAAPPTQQLDYGQAGIDFVLGYGNSSSHQRTPYLSPPPQ